MLCNEEGMPLRFVITPGQDSDFTQAIPLLNESRTSYVIADKGYDSDAIASYINRNMNAITVIPARSNRKLQRQYSSQMYKKRNLIERLFNKLKNFRKLATRYEKYAHTFSSLVSLACSYLWIAHA